MFTGIIEETGHVLDLHPREEGAVIKVAAKLVSPSLKIGDSVAVNGVCLTTIHNDAESFTCELSAETFRRTSYKYARQGTKVNVERPIMVGGRLGGHFVQGHVDGVGRLIARVPSGDCVEMTFSFPPELERYLVYKGSIAVDGISLTISSLSKSSFTVAIIPHTVEVTNLKFLGSDHPVNLEVDILGKYVERFFQLGLSKSGNTISKLTPEYLRDQGY